MLKPLGDRIVVKPNLQEETIRGGIVLPDSAKKKSRQGEVLAIGSGRVLDNGQRAPMDVKVGDTVLYSEYGGSEFTFGGVEYMILEESQVLAVLEGTGESKGKGKKAA